MTATAAVFLVVVALKNDISISSILASIVLYATLEGSIYAN